MTLAKRLQFSSSVVVDILSANHPDLLAMYTMDNISGSTLIDESPNNNDGTLIGVPVFGAGRIDNAIQLSVNGSDRFTTSFNLTGEWAISLWIKVHVYESAAGVIVGDGSDVSGIAVRSSSADTDKLRAGGAVHSTQITWDTGNYIHLVMNSEGSGTFSYCNSLKSSVASSLPSTFNALTWGAKDNTGNPGDFDLDQIRVFDRALTQDEIDTLFAET